VAASFGITKARPEGRMMSEHRPVEVHPGTAVQTCADLLAARPGADLFVRAEGGLIALIRAGDVLAAAANGGGNDPVEVLIRSAGAK